MINYADIHQLATRLLISPTTTEADVRQGISAAYYSLFHRLTTEGAAVFAPDNPILAAQAARAFSHTGMRKVCEVYGRSARQPFPPPLDKLHPSLPDARLVEAADLFVKLQEERHLADYDLSASFARSDGLAALNWADIAHQHLDEIAGSPDLHIFLTALLADRWTRRA